MALIFASGWGFARSITGLLVTATDFTRQIAAGNLSTPLPPASLRDEIGALKFSLEVMRKSLVSITRDVHQGIESARCIRPPRSPTATPTCRRTRSARRPRWKKRPPA